ncbi:MAG TPA: NTP transferase domain-containing protein, partial [Pyrinomonadaceae bacterium]|nr:NTP transferase domain-containing protein [Pyrinomonadaceae bacterium]
MGLTGVIPAAGKASRMGELGAAIPKALIEIEGRTLLERSIETLHKIGVSGITVVVGHLGEQIVPRDFEVVHQEQQLGLAHAIACAKPDDDFVVLCPDNVYTDDADLIRAREVFESSKPAFLLVATV